MKELSKHIQVLLLENDCVIVPGLGGFIAHYRPAFRDEEGNFVPQMRSIGFNPRIVMNDGLLAQSYMQAYSTDFPDATRKIETVVDAVKDEIYEKGEVTFEGIGTLSYNIKGEYEFSPSQESFFTPSLYGLEPFSLPKLKVEALADAESGNAQSIAASCKSESINIEDGNSQSAQAASEESTAQTKVMPMKPIRWWQGVAAAAAAVVLFFLMSLSAENTYISEASLGTATLFDAIRGQSMISTVKVDQDNKKSTTTSTDKTTEKTTEKNNANTLKPTSVKTEVVEQDNTDANDQDKTLDNKDKKATNNEQQSDKKTTDNKQTNATTNNSSNKQTNEQPSSSTTTKKANSTSSESNSVSTKKDSSSSSSTSSSSSSSSSTLGKLFYVIVSSLTNSSDAEKEVSKLKSAGYTDAQVIESDGRYRVAVTSCSSQSEAYNKIEQYQNEGSFDQAWVLNSNK